MNKEQLISELLCLPSTAISYHMGKHLAELFPDKAMIEVPFCDVEGYASAGQCVITRKTFSYNQVATHWIAPEPGMMYQHPIHIPGGGFVMNDMGGISPSPEQMQTKQRTADRVEKAWLEATWEGNTFDILILQIDGTNESRTWLITENEELARTFYATVCAWHMEIRSEVLVFDSGHWHKDEHLFQDIKGANFDNLILKGNLKQEIREDLEQFFASRELYEEHDVPWKRGILLVGPAGNGKTHTVKALINSLGHPCLYVKSFRSPHSQGADEIHIRQVFERARRSAPCVLVLEDLDSLITPQNRSFFLNELDGFAANIGIVALATTNHPERLDPAILDRPSRFDRKYPFNLPEQPERLTYINMWNASLKPLLRLSDAGAVRISELTEDFSFAYLKELFLSSKMKWIAHPQQGTMEEVIAGQVTMLREQMVSAHALLAEAAPEDQSMPPPFPSGMRGGFMWRGR